jgi:hypothetical protein
MVFISCPLATSCAGSSYEKITAASTAPDRTSLPPPPEIGTSVISQLFRLARRTMARYCSLVVLLMLTPTFFPQRSDIFVMSFAFSE